jgi:hypothetical protein
MIACTCVVDAESASSIDHGSWYPMSATSPVGEFQTSRHEVDMPLGIDIVRHRMQVKPKDDKVLAVKGMPRGNGYLRLVDAELGSRAGHSVTA